jgi:PTS system nitrogen regulatory IIA component
MNDARATKPQERMNEVMSLTELASYLGREARALDTLAARQGIPARKVSGQWRFSRTEIDRWLDRTLLLMSSADLGRLEAGSGPNNPSPELTVVSDLMDETLVALPLLARTRTSVLRALVLLAERSGCVFTPRVLLHMLQDRENACSTALENGAALPHPRYLLPDMVGGSFVAFGRTSNGIPFGEPGGRLTDVYFLVCCVEPGLHLRVLARLARILRGRGVLQRLRAAVSPSDLVAVIHDCERVPDA